MSAQPQAAISPSPEQEEPYVLRTDTGGVTTLTLNRPKSYNTLSEQMLEALQSAVDDIARDESVRVVVLAGEGKAFCAGHDLKQMRAKPDRAYYGQLFAQCSRFMLSLMQMPQPVIARIHGIAAAAGCQLAGTCDLAIATPEAKFATSGINVGLFCSTPAVAVSRNMPRKPAFEMLMTGDFVDAETAKDLGLINHVVPAEELDAAIAALCAKITAKSRVAIETGKRMFYTQMNKGVEDAYSYAAEVMADNMMARDVGEGIDAFIGKRYPVWEHR